MKKTLENNTDISQGSLTIIVITTLLGAFLILFSAVLPVEFGQDPFGWGKILGLNKLAETQQAKTTIIPQEISPLHYLSKTPYRSLTLKIKLGKSPDMMRKDQVEYKLRMNKGQSFIYSWTVKGLKKDDKFYVDFHGHTTAKDPLERIESSYREGLTTQGSGSFSAPFNGVHGWYFLNQATNPVTVELRVSGFFELVPIGELGNESGLEAIITTP